MMHASPPAVFRYDARPVYSVFHEGAEYWVYVDHGVYKTCNGTVVRLSMQERRSQPHPERLHVTCNDNHLDAHALHPTPSPTPRRRHRR
jgi:hypothetical protein